MARRSPSAIPKVTRGEERRREDDNTRRRPMTTSNGERQTTEDDDMVGCSCRWRGLSLHPAPHVKRAQASRSLYIFGIVFLRTEGIQTLETGFKHKLYSQHPLAQSIRGLNGHSRICNRPEGPSSSCCSKARATHLSRLPSSVPRSPRS